MLFCICVDPLLEVSISNTCALSMYADDVVLYRPIFTISDVSCLQSDVDIVCLWVEDAGLRLNVRKTKSMLVGRKRQRPTLSLQVSGSAIEQVSSFRYLGVWLSSDLSWSLHMASSTVHSVWLG